MRKSLSDLPQGFYHKEEYPGLPEQLKQFNYYINDAGHSIMAIPNALIKKAHGSGELWNYKINFIVMHN